MVVELIESIQKDTLWQQDYKVIQYSKTLLMWNKDTVNYRLFFTPRQLIAFKHNIPNYPKSQLKLDQAFLSGEP